MTSAPAAPRATACRTTFVLGAAACAAVGLFVLAVSWFRIESLDTGYHLAYGKYFLEHGRIVDRDPFLYPEHAEPFVNANWGSQVIMALAYRAAGPAGLIALRTVLILTIFAGIALSLRTYTSSLEALACAWLLAAAAGYERFSLRPELFSYALMAVMLVMLSRGVQSTRAVVGLTVLQLAWVNLHSYFLVGVLMSVAWLGGAAIMSVLRPTHGDRTPWRPLAAALALQLVVCLVNPWHWRGAIFPLQTLSYLNRENIMGAAPDEPAANAWSLISEFHSPFRYAGELIGGRTIDAYWALLAVALAGAICNALQARLGQALLILLMTVMSLQMRRNVAQMAFVISPLALGAVAAASRRVVDARAAKAARWLPAAATAALAIWWTVAIAAGRFYYEERRITRQLGVGLSDRTFAVQAVRWLGEHADLKPRLFVDYFSSSNTLPWLPQRFKLFVDTNTFAYRPQTLGTAFDLGLGRIKHADIFDRLDINVVLLHCGPDTQALVKRLVADYTNWALVYFDRQAVIFLRRIPEHVALIRGNQPASGDLNPQRWIDEYHEPAHAKALSLATAVNVPICLGWYAPAAEILEHAVRLAPDYHDAWTMLGVCHANLGNAAARAGNLPQARAHYAAALDHARKALVLQPHYVPARSLRHDMEQVLQQLGPP